MISIEKGAREQSRIETEAMAWKSKLAGPALQNEELEAFGVWMVDPENAQAYADCEWSSDIVEELKAQSDRQWDLWCEEAFQRAQGGGSKVEPLADWSELLFARASQARTRKGSKRFGQVAAFAACLGILAIAFSWQPTTPPATLRYETSETIREVMLPDGSRLTLDVNTKAEYVDSGELRRLLLRDGRVYLDVAKDALMPPFVVRSGEIETVVLGTRFQVVHSEESTEVLLEEGRVQMQHVGSSVSTVLLPGQRGWWSEEAREFSTATTSPSSVLAWTRGRLMFESVPLADAVAEVNRYSKRVHIQLADETTGQLVVSGSYVSGDAELVIAAWVATLPVEALHDGDTITLKRR